MTDPRAPWLAEAQSLLPDESQILARNRAITATYAALYLEHRDVFKWAGMAAFASFQVGLALEPLGWGLDIAELNDELDLIRRTNNAVYADIAWAHLAYDKGGIEEIRRCLGGTKRQHLLRSGFEQLHRGKRLGATDSHLVWDGNALLLEHEQHQTVQPRFEHLDRLFGQALTLTTMLDFDGDHRRIDRRTVSAFTTFMMTRGLHMVALTGGFPNILSFEQRWYWILKSLLPKWRQVDTSEPRLTAIMKRFIAQARG